MRKAEIIIIALCIVSVILNFMLVPGGVLFTLITLLALSTLYFYLGFALFNGIRLRKIFKKESYAGINALRIVGCIGTGMALSLLVIGLLFKLLAWPGSFINLLAGLFFVTVVLIISIIKFIMTKSSFYKLIIIRCAIFFIIGFIFINLRPYAIMDYKYKDFPAYLKAFKAHEADPMNPELQQKLEEERIKMEKLQDS
jgi:hypothetical protein